MKWSQTLIPTLKEVPADAEVPSHRLMVRAGMIRKLISGVYCYLPLGVRSLQRATAVVREEMNRAGAQEVLLPALQPLSLWRESGRDKVMAGVFYQLTDRRQKELVLGPTHEEVITDLVKAGVSSYRHLPLVLYQIQTKFRDEPRPRSGVIRSCEFIMKDGYSFHVNVESLQQTYRTMHDAYHRVFERCGVQVVACEADTGAMGGRLSHEFMAPSPSGEDTIVRCSVCRYAANRDAAACVSVKAPAAPAATEPVREVATPGVTTVEQVSRLLKVTPKQLVKTLIVEADGAPVAVLVRGDHEVHLAKLARLLGVASVRLASAEVIQRLTGAPVGFAGPVGLSGVTIVADASVEGLSGVVTGANRADTHLVNVSIARDVQVKQVGDVRYVTGEDVCPSCRQPLRFEQAIEVGHIFQLGTRYSERLGLTVADETGRMIPVIMGCYGIGVNRILAAAIEQRHDEQGIIWPRALSPYDVLIAQVSAKPEAVALAERLQQELETAGYAVLWDDRDCSAGVKFNDADLIGMPVRIVIGDKGLSRGEIEVQPRGDREGRRAVPPDRAVSEVKNALDRGTMAPVA